MAVSATSLFSTGSTATATSQTSAQSRAASLAQLKRTRELAAMSSLSKLGVALAGAKYDSKTTNGIVHYEDNYVDVPTYKRVVSYRTETIYENRPIYEDRNVTTAKTIYQNKDVMGTRPTYATQDVFEDQPVYETRDFLGTSVAGTKPANAWSDLAGGGIAAGSSFSLQVGSGQAATVTFGADNRISVTTGSTTSDFGYDGSSGSMSAALRDALNSVDGIDASFDDQGQLKMATASGESLTLGGDDSDPTSPLAALGLAAGTVEPTVTGTEQVQTGTNHVKVGEEQVETGTEDYVVKTQKIAVGIKNVVTGTEQVQIGLQKVATGSKQVIDNTTYVKTGTTPKFAGSTRVQEQATTESVLNQTSHKKILAAALSLDVAIGPDALTDGSANPLAGLRSQVNLDKLKTTDQAYDISIATLSVTSVLKAYQKSQTSSSTTKTA